MCWISFLLLSGACSKKPPEPISVEDSTQCKADCVMVTKGFVMGRFVAEEQVVRLKAALKICQEKL